MHSQFSIFKACQWTGKEQQKSKSPNMPVSSWGQTRQHSAFLSQLSYCNQVFFSRSFTIYLVSHFSPHFCAFYCWVCCLKWFSSIVCMCHMLFLSESRPWCALWSKDMKYDTFHCGWYSAVGCEQNVNESGIYIKNVFKQKKG